MNLNTCPYTRPGIIVLLILLLGLSACGQKGDLYLPSAQTVAYMQTLAD